MTFNAFDIIRRKSATADIPVMKELSGEEAINALDRFVCLVLASNAQHQAGERNTYFSDPSNKEVFPEAQRAAETLRRMERTGQQARRVFSDECWREWIAVRSYAEVLAFCECDSMRPELLWKIILM